MEEKKKELIDKGLETSPDSGKSIYDESTGIIHRPDKRKMYKDWFNEARDKAIQAGFIQSSLISLDEIKGIKKPKSILRKKTSKKRK